MSIKSYFPTFIYEDRLLKDTKALKCLLKNLKDDSFKIFEQDKSGQNWSETNYANGYTSYSSFSNLHEINSTFIDLKKHIDKHVQKFAKSLGFSNEIRTMQSCWLNIMPPKASHSLHLHPLSAISGTFYVTVPKGSGVIKFEDPRLSKMMASPERKDKFNSASFARYTPQSGQVILFESWLRHEVETNTGKEERISISFNYS
jgi:uncharacterized protein (TIGR02466 family)